MPKRKARVVWPVQAWGNPTIFESKQAAEDLIHRFGGVIQEIEAP